MASTLHLLKTYYSNVMRVAYTHIPAADLQALTTLAAQYDAGGPGSLPAVTAAIAKMAANTTSVATMAYQFFTDRTPGYVGLDFLISPQGGNANNLNSAYYQSFNIENRYINFAVNLGKIGEGAAAFSQQYGALSLRDATAKAYVEIFGATPDAAKLDFLLNATVSNGVGGTYSRAEYFASYGGDGVNGIWTKAAVIGWLLTEAIKGGVGPYAEANEALLADLAPDGVARVLTDMVDAYVPMATLPVVGATINFTGNQSVTPTASDAALKSTEYPDTITGSAGLDAVQQVLAGGGDDLITIAGAVGGLVDGGAGNDRITVGTLNAGVAVIGGSTTGTIRGGAGNDKITVTTRLALGSTVEGGAGDDTLTAAISESAPSNATVTTTGVEHVVITSAQPLVPLAMTNMSGVTDIYSQANTGLTLTDVQAATHVGLRDVTSGVLKVTYHTDLVIVGKGSTQVGAATADIHLVNVRNAPASGADATQIVLANVAGPVRLHVDSTSVLSSISVDPNATLTAGGGVLVIDGVGDLTTGVGSTFNVVDARAAASVNLTRFGTDYLINTATLSAGDDKIAIDLLRSVNAAISTVTLGAGSDTLSLYQDGFNAPRFDNLRVTDSKVDAYLAVSDFQKGIDHIDLTSRIATVNGGLSAGSATTLEQALVNISPQVSSGSVGVFEFGGDTWIYRQDATVGVNSGDGLIRLVGVTGLSIATGATASDIHYG